MTTTALVTNLLQDRISVYSKCLVYAYRVHPDMSLEDIFHIGFKAKSYFNKQKPEPEAPLRFSQLPKIPGYMMQLQHITQ